MNSITFALWCAAGVVLLSLIVSMIVEYVRGRRAKDRELDEMANQNDPRRKLK